MPGESRLEPGLGLLKTVAEESQAAQLCSHTEVSGIPAAEFSIDGFGLLEPPVCKQLASDSQILPGLLFSFQSVSDGVAVRLCLPMPVTG